MSNGRNPRARDLRDPVVLLALGFGAGLVPRAPGTAGTLVGIPLFLLLALAPPLAQGALTLALVVAGIPICARAGRRLGQHDHPAIVWDELACLPIALAVVPPEPAWIAAGFVVFRLFDIAKPWPISTVDRHLGGGIGVMADDLLAALASAAVLYGAVRLVGA